MKDMVKISKFLSLALRHEPEAIHLNMDNKGWVDVDESIMPINIRTCD
jgi:putative RNA 2'-phosphotransferase